MLLGTAPQLADAIDDQIGPGLLAFAVVALLGVATFLLIRSMLYHLRKVPPSFDTQVDDQADDEGDADGSGPRVG